MPTNIKWTKTNSVVTIVVMLAVLIGWFTVGEWKHWLGPEQHPSARPATIKNVILRIDSNIIRLQIIMEDLVFPEYTSDLADSVKAVNSMEEEIYKDFKAMGEHFQADNAEYHKAFTLFRQWKPIRNQVIKLTQDGPSQKAKQLVLGESASHAQEIREALKKLDRFSEKRAETFDSNELEDRKTKNR